MSTEVVYLGSCLVPTWLVPRKLLSFRLVLCTPYNHALCHFMQSHSRRVHACIAVTYHLHFWQNDRDLLLAPTVAREWNKYRNKSTES